MGILKCLCHGWNRNLSALATLLCSRCCCSRCTVVPVTSIQVVFRNVTGCLSRQNKHSLNTHSSAFKVSLFSAIDYLPSSPTAGSLRFAYSRLKNGAQTWTHAALRMSNKNAFVENYCLVNNLLLDLGGFNREQINWIFGIFGIYWW